MKQVCGAIGPDELGLNVRPVPWRRTRAATMLALAALAMPLVANADGTAVYRTASAATVVVLQARSLGSGVLLAPTLAVTNCHVVDEGSDAVVRFKQESRTATVAARNTQHDVCVLQLDRPFPEARPVASARRLSGISPGEAVYALGAPTGLTYSLTAGVVSQLRHHEGGTVIQFDASISSGNSGGGLFDQRGALLGLTSFSREASPTSGASTQNLNFAWSVDNFPSPAKELIARLVANAAMPTTAQPKANGGSQSEASAPPRGDSTAAAAMRRWQAAFEAQDWAESLQAANEWIARQPIEPRARIAKGRSNEAIKAGSGLPDFQYALQLQHGHQEALLQAARSARAQGDLAGFSRYKRTLESINPVMAAKI